MTPEVILCPQARGEPFSIGQLLPSRNRNKKQFTDLEMTSGMDPLGFGPASANHNAQMLHMSESSNSLMSNSYSKGSFM